MTPQSPVITTERLILRPLRPSDADDLLQYQSHADTVRYIPWPQRTRQQVIEALEKHASEASEHPEATGEFALLAWELRETRQVIGQGNLGIVRASNRHAEIGWVTHPKFVRQGFALEATVALLDWAFGGLGLHRVTAAIDRRNQASARLAERLGMRCEAEHIDDDWFKGEWTSTLVYAILASEWRSPSPVAPIP